LRKAVRLQLAREEELDDFHESKVILSGYLGVAPRRYERFFTMTRRKNDDGTIRKWAPVESVSRVSSSTAHFDYSIREENAVESLRTFIR
jgi:hypothetical protein